MRSAVLASLLIVSACGPSSGTSTDAGDEHYGIKPFDAGVPDIVVEAPAKVPWNRMTAHNGVILATPHIRAIYVGDYGAGGSRSFDAFIQWAITSTDYWGAVLSQYGLGYGTFDGSTTVDIGAFFPPGMLDATGHISANLLDQRMQDVVHQPPPPDAGADASADGGDAAATLPPIPPADAYILFLPDGVTVDLGFGEETCVQADGYHSVDGIEPFSVIPDCGRYELAVSHELAEMCTDPQPGSGWFSDKDIQNAGGEVGDLCNFPIQIDGHYPTALWSNKDGDCEPP